jgi:hypothetical protein
MAGPLVLGRIDGWNSPPGSGGSHSEPGFFFFEPLYLSDRNSGLDESAES